MTIDFVDVLTVDRDTSAFLLATFSRPASVDPVIYRGHGSRD
jgi:hypothetical protein